MLEVLKKDRKQVIYRPELNEITGSVTATILFQQILYRFDNNEGKPFYKFKEPCTHNKYREGDSWVEELGFSRREFDGALAAIGSRVKKGLKKPTHCLVWYWTGGDRTTYFEVNEEYAAKVISDLYEKYRSHVSKSTPTPLHNSTENTTEITTKKEESVPTEVANPPKSSLKKGCQSEQIDEETLQAIKWVDHLATKTGVTMNPIDKVNGKPAKYLSEVKSRIIEYGLDTMIQVTDLKFKEWFQDEKMRSYLVVETLCRKSNTEKYVRQLQLSKPTTSSQPNRLTREEEAEQIRKFQNGEI